MKYNYNKETHSLKGIPEMEKPDEADYYTPWGFFELTFEQDLKAYIEHLASLPDYPLPADTPKPEWWPEELEEFEHFKTKMDRDCIAFDKSNKEKHNCNCGWVKVAIPLPEPKKQVAEDTEGEVTVVLIDAIVSISRVLNTRDMFDDSGAVQEALKDLRDTDGMKMLMDIGDLSAAKEHIKEQNATIKNLLDKYEPQQNPNQEKQEESEDELRKKIIDELINKPQVIDFIEGVKTEIAHQYERWGDESLVPPHHFSMVLSYLVGKLNRSIWDNDKEKFVHHLITIAAVAGCTHKYLNTDNSEIQKWFTRKTTT